MRRGIEHHQEESALELIAAGVEAESFLKLRHTRNWFRKELSFPGPCIDRQGNASWLADGGKTAAERGHGLVEQIIASEGPPLEPAVVAELDRLATA